MESGLGLWRNKKAACEARAEGGGRQGLMSLQTTQSRRGPREDFGIFLESSGNSPKGFKRETDTVRILFLEGHFRPEV